MNNIGNTATSFFERLTILAAFGVRYVVFIGRKYPLIAVGFLLFYAFFCYQLFFSQPSNLASQPHSSSTSLNRRIPTTTPVVEAAQASAYKNDSVVTIRWNKPVESPRISDFSRQLKTECQPKSCSINLEEIPERLKVRWRQLGQSFEKTFRFSSSQ